jgi:hypothetical protein
MEFYLRSPPPNKTLLVALALALGLHGMLLFIEFNIWAFEPTTVSKRILVNLMLDDQAIKQEPQVDEIAPEPSPVLEDDMAEEASSPVEVSSVIAVDSNQDDQNSIQTISINQVDVQRWIHNDAFDFVDQTQKRQLNGLRRGSYEQALLDPSRPDQRTSLSSEAIETSDGVIHVQKIKGKLVCRLKGNSGEAFNDLDLAPLSGKKMGYACGDVKKLNILLTKDGGIKNSDTQEWSISD